MQFQELLTMPIFLTLLFVAVLNFSNFMVVNAVVKEPLSACNWKKCAISAHNLQMCMKPKLNPCNDFYEFACGSYSDNHPIPPGFIWMDPSAERQTNILNTISDALHKPKAFFEPQVIYKAKDLYASCMDIETMDKLGLQPIIELLKSVNLPSTFSFDSKFMSTFSWFEIAANFNRKLNLNFIFEVTADRNPTNVLTNTIYIMKENARNIFPAFDDGGKINLKYADHFRNYVKFIIKLFSKPNAEEQDEQLDRYINKLYKFIYVREQIKNRARRRNAYSYTISIEQLENLTKDISDGLEKGSPPIDWIAYLNAIFKDYANTSIEIDNQVEIINIDYVKDMLTFLSKSDPMTIAMAMWLDVVTKYQNHATKELRSIYFRFRRATHKEKRPIVPRDQICATQIIELLGMPITYQFLTFRNLQLRKRVVQVELNYILKAFREKILNSDWMDKESRDASLIKLRDMKKYISFPEHLFDGKNKLDEIYRSVNFVKDRYVENILAFNQFKTSVTLSLLSKQNLPHEPRYIRTPMVGSAAYDYTNNALIVPLALLDYPFYEHGSHAMNFGSLGFLIAREIAHGFDSIGKEFNKIGNKRSPWNDSTRLNFEERAKCFVDSYNKLSVKGFKTNVDGELTQNENIADSIALSVVLMAYDMFSYMQRDYYLPGFKDFSAEKMITLSFATTFCSNSSEQFVRQQLREEQCPNVPRILGTMINSKEFADIWGCKEGTRMNPAKSKCKIF